MPAPRPIELNRIKSRLDDILTTQQLLEETDDAPFVIYLTERMLRDIEECRRSCQSLKRRVTWPSLN
jgi:hypothetical protein